MVDVEVLFRTARRLEHQQKWKEAIAAYSRILHFDPGLLNAYYHRQDCLREVKRFSEAERDLEQIITLTSRISVRPDQEQILELRADAFHEKGELYLDQEQWKAALDPYQQSNSILQALSQDPRRAGKMIVNYYKRGFLLSEKLEEQKQAVEEFTKGLAIVSTWREKHLEDNSYNRLFNQRWKEGYRNRAIAHQKSGNISAAEADFLQLDDVSANVFIGKMYFDLGDMQRAERHLETGLEIPHVPCAASIAATDLLFRIKATKESRNN